MKPQRALVRLLVVLLLFAQQGAYAHAVSHLGKAPPVKEQPAHAKVCDRCASFERIAGVAPVSLPAVALLDASAAVVAHGDYAHVLLTVVPFQGRAPPLLR